MCVQVCRHQLYNTQLHGVTVYCIIGAGTLVHTSSIDVYCVLCIRYTCKHIKYRCNCVFGAGGFFSSKVVQKTA